ncbi:hypothetical protein HYR99_41290 [Candidatus Poribacteria bacterium]|nr:hypothetical protein [Candidatus Poribacteria bacterium]
MKKFPFAESSAKPELTGKREGEGEIAVFSWLKTPEVKFLPFRLDPYFSTHPDVLNG